MDVLLAMFHMVSRANGTVHFNSAQQVTQAESLVEVSISTLILGAAGRR